MSVRFLEQEVVAATGAQIACRGSGVDYQGVCTDTRALTQGCLFVALLGPRFNGHDFVAQAVERGARGAVVERGRPVSVPQSPATLFEVDNTLGALGALARFHRARFPHTLVAAVTGSNGKTTTKEMVHAILAVRGPALKSEGNLNNEVGVPLTLFRLEPIHVAAAIEMGMSGRGEIARLTAIANPNAGVITSVHPAHLKTLEGVKGVAEAKGELFQGLGQDATAVVNADDPLIVEQAERSQKKKLTFGQAPGAEVRLSQVELKGREGIFASIQYRGKQYRIRLKFVGAHNASNATGAFALAVALGYSPEECVRGLEAAQPQPHRLNLLESGGGFLILDDCYNANPASMSAALSTLQSLAGAGRAVAVLGDMLELGLSEASEHRALGEKAAQAARLVAFFGPRSEEAHRAAAALDGAAAHFVEVEPLLAWLKPRLRPKDVVLVKASRGMQLERVVDALLNRPPERGAH